MSRASRAKAIAMRIEDYPPQEPLSDVGRAFAKEVTRRAKGVGGAEHFYGDDP